MAEKEYIDKVAYNNAIRDAVKKYPNSFYNGLEVARQIAYDFPAADVRPVVKAVWKHVQWVVDEEWQEGGYWISRCSNCLMPYNTETPFCPHCGADMREES